LSDMGHGQPSVSVVVERRGGAPGPHARHRWLAKVSRPLSARDDSQDGFARG
jgi:hypothetical protein